MRLITLSIFLFISTVSNAETKFFARPHVQAVAPSAFALQPQSKDFVLQAQPLTIQHAKQLITLIGKDDKLMAALENWQQLSFAQQKEHLLKVFQLEWQSFSITPPKLVIDEFSYPNKTVYFDFDPSAPSSGTVYLNPVKIAQMDKYAALAFLIHETRHSYQFQLATSNASKDVNNKIAANYLAAFTHQKTVVPGTLNFAEFLTLNNEYEAFQFGNYVVNHLTNNKFNQSSMGTFASQYDQHGTLKIDLPQLFKDEQNLTVLERFNIQQQAQQKLLTK